MKIHVLEWENRWAAWKTRFGMIIFEIKLEMDDIIDFSSFKKGIQILKKYKVN